MRCRNVRKALLDDSALTSVAVQGHLRTCASCAAYLQQWAKLQTGLRRVAEQAPPEPSVGFARRVVRGLNAPAGAGYGVDLSLLRAGRRFVYAALPAALRRVLGGLMPASGPVRSPSAAAEAVQPEAVAAQNYPIFSGGLLDNDFEFASQSGSR